MPARRISDSVKRIFTETFTARDVAESLASFDSRASSQQVRAFMEARDFDVVGIRQEGQFVGFVDKDSLGDGTCGQYMQALDGIPLLSDSDPMLTVLMEMNRARFLFVTMLGSVSGIVTPADMQKPAVRMWLFGIVTMIEMRCTELIEHNCPADSWKTYLSEARLQKAQALLAERSRRNQTLQLFDCLQFSDKGQIVARNEVIRKSTIFASRRQAEEAIKGLEQLRNNLAHAQDFLTSDWDTIIQLCEFITQQKAAALGTRCDQPVENMPCPKSILASTASR
jgi:hypothetical protein